MKNVLSNVIIDKLIKHSNKLGAVAEWIRRLPRDWKVPRLNPSLTLSFLPDCLNLFNSFCFVRFVRLVKKIASISGGPRGIAGFTVVHELSFYEVQFYIILLAKMILLGCNL